jgi:hypothetical protein
MYLNFRRHLVPNHLRTQKSVCDEIEYDGKDRQCADPECHAFIQEGDTAFRIKTTDPDTRERRVAFFCSKGCIPKDRDKDDDESDEYDE